MLNGKALGQQLAVEFYGCQTDRLNDVEYVETVMKEAADLAGATIVGCVFHKFNPHGVSGVVVIAESHLAIHTWPEYGYAAVDLFTCGDEVNPYRAFNFLKESFVAAKYDVQEILRGLVENIGQPIVYKPAGVLE